MLVDWEAFHAERRSAITSTDMPKILGLSAWGSPRSVYLDKVDPIPPKPMSTAARIGLELEPAVARFFSEDTGLRVRRLRGFYRSEGRPWVASHADYRVVGERSLLECKTRRDDTGWGPPLSGVVPVDVWVQCQMEMHCLALDRAYVGVMFGFGAYRTLTFERDDEFLRGALDTADRFWHDNVLAGVMPDMIFADLPALSTEYPQVTEDVLRTATPDIEQLIERYAVAREQRLEAQKHEDTLKARLQRFIGSNAGVTSPSGTVTWKPDEPNPQFDSALYSDMLTEEALRHGVPAEALAELRSMSYTLRQPQRVFLWRKS